jgi:calcineurin-like phosphoesterase family protein
MASWFTADLHLGHENIIKYCSRPFANAGEMDARLIDTINACARPTDVLYILGDLSHGPWGGEEYLERVTAYRHRIACENVFLIVGNHDRVELPGFRKLFREVRSLVDVKIEGQRLTLCHYAMRTWNRSHHGSWQLYGHTHGRLDDAPMLLSIDVGVDSWDFRPLSFHELKDIMERRIERRDRLAAGGG